jgi:Domain of unknown function (DUF4267)
MALVLAGLFGVFLAAMGSVFLLSPQAAVAAFGVDPSHMADLGLAPAIGIRQMVYGVTLAALAIARKRSALAIVLLLGALVPLGDYFAASKALGHTQAIRQLIAVPVFLILGFTLIRQ